MKKVEQIKKIVEGAFEPYANKVILATTRQIKESLHTEWVVVEKITNQIIAVFTIGSLSLYEVKFINANYLYEIAKLKTTIYNTLVEDY